MRHFILAILPSPAFRAAAEETRNQRTVVQDQEGVSIRMAALCEAEKTACDKLLAEFQAPNERLRDDIRRGAGRPPPAETRRLR